MGEIIRATEDGQTLTVRKFHRLDDLHKCFAAKAKSMYDKCRKLSSGVEEVVGCSCQNVISVGQIFDLAFIVSCKDIDNGHLRVSPRGMVRVFAKRIDVDHHDHVQADDVQVSLFRVSCLKVLVLTILVLPESWIKISIQYIIGLQ